MRFAAIILAAGKSERFGSPKLLQPFQGKSLVMHAVEAAKAIVNEPVLVVTGAWKEEVERELAGTGVMCLYNDGHAEGMASSIRKGIEVVSTVEQPVDGTFILVGDQPYVDKGLLSRMMLRQEATGLPIVASHYGEVIGTPVFFLASMFPQLMELKGDKGARPILQKEMDRVATVLFPDGSTDIDTPEDYQRLLNPKDDTGQVQ